MRVIYALGIEAFRC